MSSLYKTKSRMTSNADHSASISILSAKLTPLALVQLTSESLVNKVMQSVAQGYQFYLVNTDLTDGMTCTRDGGRYTLTNIAGNYGVFDIDADTIDIDNFEKFSYTASTLKGIIAIEKNGDCL